MTGIIVLSAVLVVLLIGFVWFYVYSRTLAWGESDTRKALLNMMIVVGPIFGMHYKEPRPEPPTISTPGGDAKPAVPGLVVPPAPDADDGS